MDLQPLFTTLSLSASLLKLSYLAHMILPTFFILSPPLESVTSQYPDVLPASLLTSLQSHFAGFSSDRPLSISVPKSPTLGPLLIPFFSPMPSTLSLPADDFPSHHFFLEFQNMHSFFYVEVVNSLMNYIFNSTSLKLSSLSSLIIPQSFPLNSLSR